ncbi:translocation/assembly module TamB domain-containing protein [Sphingomonas sp. LB-2]|uniref:translocation/assembly module TamB domain-containing protein n=1 Tax=Sphingomonas caeni TaxID=2984949 RepID=UPI00222F6943|nr:translocation/assembly module TamB domain-containing protein [Sphingomonas caeni]MCW3849298.1 translocation/assembly module TamB domain-containing protein [Sphingomonas caeni]
MVLDTPQEPVAETVAVREPVWRRVAKWSVGVVVTLAVLAGAALLGLNTGPGRALVARQISGTTFASGLNIRIGRIDGSLYGALVLRDVEVRDAKGTFGSAQQVALDWRPFSYFANRIDVRSVASPVVKIARLPELKPGDPNAPTLPDIKIDVANLDLARIEIAEGVTGRRHVAQLSGSAHIADGRAVVDANAATLVAPGIAGGDRVAVRLNAVPDQDKLDIDLRLTAPANGLVAGLAGVSEPLTLSVEGKGSWSSWKGEAVGTLGGAELADLQVEAHSGTFSLRGPAKPGLYMKGPVERLADPQVDVALEVKWRDRVADTHLVLKSKAAEVTCDGVIDLAHNRWGEFRAEALLLTPGSIAPNLNGREVRVGVLLNGPFARPVVDYKLQAAVIGFGETRVEGLYAEGKARVNANRILVPVKAKAARVTGLNEAAGGLVTNMTLEGSLGINGDQLLSDNLKLKSDRIDATVIVAADLSQGRYTAALKGRVNDYEVAGLGEVNLVTDAKLFPAPGGGWGISGHVIAATTRYYTETVRDFMGGDAVASSDVTIDAEGVIRFTNMRGDAPRFRLTRGNGRYNADGSILFDAEGVSDPYGPMTAHVTGSLGAPVVLLRVPHPGLGVGLADLEAVIRGNNGVYAIDAKGGTDYGPFAADVLVRSGTAITVDVRAGRFAGMGFTGRLIQTRAGPYSGDLAFNGSGVNGTAHLSAQGSVQRADVDATATNATIPGVAELTIGRAVVKGSIVLTETPQIVGDAQVAALRQGDFIIKTARVKIDYRGGSGTAQLLASGSSGVPFRIAANARLSPREWIVAVAGQGDGINFKTAQPARIAVEKGTYRLLPTRVTLDKGSARIAGTYGKGLTLQARLDSLDLSVINAFVPGLGVGGSATGSVDFTQASPSAFPGASARLEIADFTRSSLSAVSTPVNLTFVGKLFPDGGEGRALIRRGATTVGRMVVTLRPIGPEGGSWQNRLWAAPLAGGIRYNGPAAVIFSLAGLSDQHLEGPIGVAADFTGRLNAPQLTGVVRASNLTYENETFGTRLSGMKIDGRFSNDQLILNSMTAVAGTGTVSARGTIGLASRDDYPMDVTVDLANARLARSDALGATATGQIKVTRNAQGHKIAGRLDIPEARYQVIRQGAAEVPQLTGVRRKSDVLKTPEQRANAKGYGAFDLDLRIRADNQLFVSGMGLESEWRANITIGGTTADPLIGGNATVVRGTYDFAGRRFTINRGTIRFQDRKLTNPAIDIGATANAEGITAILTISGTAQQPRVAFTSSPALPQDEVLSRILFGSSVTNLSATEAIQLAAALNSLTGSGGGLNPLGKLRSVVGIDRLRILSPDDASGRGTALAAGQYITDDIYIEVITDARGFTATQLEIALSRALSILSSTSSFGGTGVSLRYSRDY